MNEDIDTLENDLFAMREFSLEQASRIVKIDEELTTSNSELTQVKQENMELRVSLRYMYNFDLTWMYADDVDYSNMYKIVIL